MLAHSLFAFLEFHGNFLTKLGNLFENTEKYVLLKYKQIHPSQLFKTVWGERLL